ncbi:MAG: hypothetical protein KKF89_05250 [Nanoarchaeota archaeon]|nr:hypothetical protein [Nanoarchaeota archaeon]MBU1855101.1 hypothetical protein [Nanoarchaeota archaeon]
MINKKGQGMSINVIIIAAIAMLVLVILAILVGRSGTHVSENTECIKKAGICREKECEENKQIGLMGEYCQGNMWCCSPVSLE